MLVKCPHCHMDFLLEEREVKDHRGLVVNEIVHCPECNGAVTVIDRASISEPKARAKAPRLRPLTLLVSLPSRLVPAKLRNLSGSESTVAQIVILGVALLVLLVVLQLQGTFGDWSLLPRGAARKPMSDRAAAATAAQSYVRNRLENRAQATFPPIEEVNIIDLGGNLLKASSWVEERDLMGNHRRTTFVCTLKHTQSNNYALDTLVIGNDTPKKK